MSARRPFGTAAGTVGLTLAWLGGAAIVQLTGATAVLILLTTGMAAVAVAADLVAGALGTDTGGSVRVPAALCGVVGLKGNLAPEGAIVKVAGMSSKTTGRYRILARIRPTAVARIRR